MELKEIAGLIRRQDPFEIRVIGHAGSRYYQLELEDSDGTCHEVMHRGKPLLFRALDEVKATLKRQGIHRAYLVHHVPQDEVVGREANYRNPLSSRIPLVF
ncbi:DUF6482 family protein [Pistricoccus aurantiacus]|uniref:DUF6482 family protein n=1 Tax=Pistricoccus aurantiacus TaxID=1883414 RepID=UPI00364464BA